MLKPGICETALKRAVCFSKARGFCKHGGVCLDCSKTVLMSLTSGLIPASARNFHWKCLTARRSVSLQSSGYVHHQIPPLNLVAKRTLCSLASLPRPQVDLKMSFSQILGRPLGYLIFSLMALIRDPIY